MKELNLAEINSVSGAGQVEITPVPTGWFDRFRYELYPTIDVGDNSRPPMIVNPGLLSHFRKPR
jgi:hypothetical protein